MAKPERVEDVFQDEIIKAISNIAEFKQFARSKYGLCLDESDIKDIIENHKYSVVDQKMELLFKWREKEGSKATPNEIRSLVRSFTGCQTGSDEGYVSLGNGMFGVYKSRPLCKRGGHIFLGEQLSRLAGVKLRAIKLVQYGKDTLREAQVLTTLETHENVVTTIHADEYDGDPYKYVFIAMELSWTQHLRNVLKKCIESQNTLEESTAMDLALQLLKGLVFIHGHDIIHRDVKCENMLISEDKKHLKLTDFGIGKIITQGQYNKITSIDVGTDGYRAPETYQNDTDISQKSDIFLTGISFAEIFSSGKHPYGDDPDLWKYNIKNDKNLDLSQLLITSYLNSAKTLLYKMLLREEKMRPSAKEVLEEFLDILQHKEDAIPSSESNHLFETIVEPPVQLSNYSQEEEPSTTANAIVVGNRQDDHMYSFKPSEPTIEWKKMQKIPSGLYTLVTVRHHLYSLHDREVKRLYYPNLSANWDRVANLKTDHGPDPPATVCNGSIHVCGSSIEVSKSVERYEEQHNAWITLPDLKEARNRPCVVATKDHVYCIGGRNDDEMLRSVERFDGVKWDYVKETPRDLFWASATLLENNVYVADRHGVLCYVIPNNSWKTLDLSKQWPFETLYLEIMSVKDKLYLVGPTEFYGYSEMYLLDPESEDMTRIQQIEEKRLYVNSSISVDLP